MFCPKQTFSEKTEVCTNWAIQMKHAGKNVMLYGNVIKKKDR